MRGLLFEAGIDVHAIVGLHHRGERTAQAGVLLAAEKLRATEGRPQLRHNGHGFLVIYAARLAPPHAAKPHPLVIVVIEDVQGAGVIRDHAQQRLGLVGGISYRSSTWPTMRSDCLSSSSRRWLTE